MPAKPRWLLAIPDAISQLEQLDRSLLTRRDIERLFGVGKVRAAALMQTFGAELVGNQRTLPRTKARPDRGAVRRAKDAVERLYAMAHALVNDYERFERLVDDGRGEGDGGGEVVNE